MKNYCIILLLIVTALFSSCKDPESRMKSIRESYESQVKSEPEVVIEDHVSVVDGSLHIKSEESFHTLTNFVLRADKGKDKFMRFLEQNNVKSLYSYYENFPEATIMKFIESRSIPDEYSSYFLFTDEDAEEEGELTLERNVQSTFLRLYFNEDMQFFINDDQIKMEGYRLFRYSNGEKQELVSKAKTSLKNGKAAATGDYTGYTYSGDKYRLKVESDTRWGEVSLYTPSGYKDFWNYVEYWAHHRKRNLLIWWASDCPEIWVYGSHWWANPATNQYEQEVWAPPHQTNTNDAAWNGVYVHTYTYTGKCIGKNSQEYWVTLSETNY